MNKASLTFDFGALRLNRVTLPILQELKNNCVCDP